MASAKSQKRLTKEQEVWIALIDYANSGEVSDFMKMLDRVLIWFGAALPFVDICKDVQQFVKSSGPACDFDHEPHDFDAALKHFAGHYHPDIKKIFAWLADPYREGFVATEGVKVLGSHLDRAKVQINWAGARGPKRHFLLDEGPGRCATVIGPASLFIKRQIDVHDYGGLRLRDAIPVGQCGRPECGRFKLLKIDRRGIGFCSDLCRATFHQQKQPKKARADYMKEYRKTRKMLDAKKTVEGKRSASKRERKSAKRGQT